MTGNENSLDLGAEESAGTGEDTAPDTRTQAGSGAESGAQLGSQEAGVNLREALEKAQAKATENHDLYLRTLAEAENMRRRAQDDVAKAHKYAIENFAESLVPVVDSLEKALQDGTSDVAALRGGVEITLRQLRAAFERAKLTEINPVGEKFDPYRHQAISAVPGDGSIAPNHVAAVLQKGWMIADRVLRPALVTVVQGS
jgi:molecular chaperone GrpE